jgi:hypothetical protein
MMLRPMYEPGTESSRKQERGLSPRDRRQPRRKDQGSEPGSKRPEYEPKRSSGGQASDDHPTRRQSRCFLLPCHRSHARGNGVGRYRPAVMTVADQAMHLAVREVEELDRVPNPITPESLNPQNRILKRHP